MYTNEFDNYHQNNKIFKSYMLWGDENYLIDIYTKKIIEKICPKDEVYSMYFKEYNFKDALTLLQSNSLFSNCNVVLIKTDKTINTKDVKMLQQACAQNDNSYLIINCFDDKSDKYLAGKLRVMSNNFDDKTNVQIRFFALNKLQALGYLNKEASDIGIIANEQNLSYLFEELDNDIYLSVNELNKLAPLNKPLDKEIINKYCFNLHNVNLGELVFMFFELSDINIIKPKFNLLLLDGYNQVLLINQFSAFISMIIRIKLYTSSKQFNARAIWGYPIPTQIAYRHQKITNRYSLATLHKLLSFFLKIDLALKIQIKNNKDSYVIVKLLKLFTLLNKQ